VRPLGIAIVSISEDQLDALAAGRVGRGRLPVELLAAVAVVLETGGPGGIFFDQVTGCLEIARLALCPDRHDAQVGDGDAVGVFQVPLEWDRLAALETFSVLGRSTGAKKPSKMYFTLIIEANEMLGR
jgi:hypothetical protein